MKCKMYQTSKLNNNESVLLVFDLFFVIISLRKNSTFNIQPFVHCVRATSKVLLVVVGVLASQILI